VQETESGGLSRLVETCSCSKGTVVLSAPEDAGVVSDGGVEALHLRAVVEKKSG